MKAKLLGCCFIYSLILCGFLFLSSKQAAAQANIDSLGIAQQIQVENLTPEEAQQGMIISHVGNDFVPTQEPYDKSTYGVVSLSPAVEFSTGKGGNSFAVMTSGTVPVLVSAHNGPIEKGSPIASSEKTGIGMLATKTGFILGVAQEEFRPDDPNEVGIVMTYLDIKFSFSQDSPDSERIGRRLLDVVSLSTIAMVEEPTTTLKYVVAALVLVGSITFSFFTFSRIASKGIDALGRNPLAGRVISMGIVLNVGISLFIIASGVIVSYLIINI